MIAMAIIRYLIIMIMKFLMNIILDILILLDIKDIIMITKQVFII